MTAFATAEQFEAAFGHPTDESVEPAASGNGISRIMTLLCKLESINSTYCHSQINVMHSFQKVTVELVMSLPHVSSQRVTYKYLPEPQRR